MGRKVKIYATPDLDQGLTPELLGQAIKARRTQSQLRLQDAAALCGVAKQTFMRIEHGEHSCQFGLVLQICASLGIELTIKPWLESDKDSDDWS